MPAAGMQRIVPCPGCGTPTPWSQANPWRPFCSERCRLIDFGQWATGAYRIAQEDANAGDEASQDQPNDA